MKLLPIGTKVVAIGQGEYIHSVKAGDKGVVVQNDLADQTCPNQVEWSEDPTRTFWTVPHKKLKKAKGKKMKLKVGDKARVIDQTYVHCFEIGQVVTIESLETGCYQASAEDGQSWAVNDEEIQKIKLKGKPLKVGDRVTFVKSGHNVTKAWVPLGTEGQILQVDQEDPNQTYKVRLAGNSWWLGPENIKKVSLKGGFKKGERAEIIGTTREANGTSIGHHPFGNGEIVSLDKWDSKYKAWRVEDDGPGWLVYPCDLRKLRELEEGEKLDDTPLRKEFEKFDIGDKVICTEHAYPGGGHEKGTELTVKEITSTNLALFEESAASMFIYKREPRFFKWVPETADKAELLEELKDLTVEGAVVAAHYEWCVDHGYRSKHPDLIALQEEILDQMQSRVDELKAQLIK